MYIDYRRVSELLLFFWEYHKTQRENNCRGPSISFSRLFSVRSQRVEKNNTKTRQEKPMGMTRINIYVIPIEKN